MVYQGIPPGVITKSADEPFANRRLHLQRWLTKLRLAHMQLDTLRLRLLRIGGWLQPSCGGLRLHLASSHSGEPLWYLLASRRPRLMNNSGLFERHSVW